MPGTRDRPGVYFSYHRHLGPFDSYARRRGSRSRATQAFLLRPAVQIALPLTPLAKAVLTSVSYNQNLMLLSVWHNVRSKPTPASRC